MKRDAYKSLSRFVDGLKPELNDTFYNSIIFNLKTTAAKVLGDIEMFNLYGVDVKKLSHDFDILNDKGVMFMGLSGGLSSINGEYDKKISAKHVYLQNIAIELSNVVMLLYEELSRYVNTFEKKGLSINSG